MPPVAIAAGIGAAGSVVGGALNRRSQNRAAEKGQRRSARDFAFFADPMLKFGEESRRFAGESYERGRGRGRESDRLFGDYESALRGEMEGLGEEAFNRMSTARLSSSLERAAPQVGRILGGVTGRGFNPTRSGSGGSQIGGLYENILQEHGRFQMGLALDLSDRRTGLAGRIGQMGQFRAGQASEARGEGIGYRSESAGINEALLAGAPPGSSEYFNMGRKGGMSVNRGPGGRPETQGRTKLRGFFDNKRNRGQGPVARTSYA